MTPAELNKAIERQDIPNLLFLYGEESFLLEKALRRLVDVAVPAEVRDFNFNAFSARECQPNAVLDIALTFPVFARHRMVLVKDAHQFTASDLDQFGPYLKNPVAETYLVFCGDKIDARRKFFQQFKKTGKLVEFKKLYDNQVPGFVRDLARGQGVRFTEDALALFCRRVGANLQEVSGELTKLSAYLGEQSLADVAEVQAVVSDTRVDSVFELTDALGKKQTQLALRLLERIQQEGSAPLLILTMIVRHFRQLWKIRAMVDGNVAEKEIPRRIGINPYFFSGLLGQSKAFSRSQYQRLFEEFLQADLAMKSSGAHPSAILENLVLGITLEAKRR